MEFFSEMSLLLQVLLIYLISINVLTFLLFGADKIKSVHNHRRIRERTLYIISLLGGSAGALVGMNFFRHKTKKLSFQAMMAVILTVHILIIFYIQKYK